jgi:hypothetical protein
MWTRGCLVPGTPNLIVPWNIPVHRGLRGRMDGNAFPGYGRGLIRGGFRPLGPGLHRGGQLHAGFGYAMDPSDPATWTRPVRWT